jgi:formylglycine-generating enzyme required for sulfatase activity
VTPLRHPLVDGYPPSWARGWGQDRYGIFVEIAVGKVRQTLRWIPGGTFWMGSPENEAGRSEWEWPRHLVTLTDGFWLADTPCTQELWQEVMGKNPSEFVSPRRPVENVSWADTQVFLERLNERIPGLEAVLPTEAQWERACRAGTETATWLGDLEILGERNAPLLDGIAWYGGNSGVDWDLEKGRDSSGWKEMQFPHKRAGTRPVMLKKPNPWGLYDMLGNVWEWCSDWSARPQAGAQDPRTDPVGPAEGPERVFRGGSWYDHARFVRAAYRYWRHPDDRSSYLGFRLSRGRGPGLRGAEQELGREGLKPLATKPRPSGTPGVSRP